MDATSLRRFVYDRLTATGRPPLLADIAANFKVMSAASREAVGSLNIGKTIVPHRQTGEIRMAGPFSADPINPFVYVAEGLRGSLTPSVPRMPMPAALVALVVITAIFWALGTRSFHKRAIG